MCVLAIQYRTAKDAPILVAQNREEALDRPTQSPRIQSGRPRVVCGIDRKFGGTWLGVNQYGLLVAAGNRSKANLPLDPRSRGLLCRELLNFSNAKEAAEYAVKELTTGKYAGVNYICADAKRGAVVYGGNTIEVHELGRGLHILTNGDLDDPTDERQELVRRQLTLQKLDSAVAFLAVAARTFSRRPEPTGRRGIVVAGGEIGTVSSTLIALPKKLQQSVYQYAPGPPSETDYEDLSALLRQVLSTEKAERAEKSQKEN